MKQWTTNSNNETMDNLDSDNEIIENLDSDIEIIDLFGLIDIISLVVLYSC